MRRAAIYTRISKDPTGQQAGVQRQEAECRAKATDLGMTVVAVFTDNDTSAYSGKARPGYDALLAAIDAGDIDAVVVWQMDRLYRRMADLERYIVVCGEEPGVPTYTARSGNDVPIDLTTPAGRMVARQLGSVAQYESEQKALRQRAANEAHARAGRAHRGGRRAFGYEPDGVTVRPDEAEAVRVGFQLILDGGSLREVARRWNAAGFRGPQKGNLWTGSTVGVYMRNARPAGIKTYGRLVKKRNAPSKRIREVIRGDDGEPIAAEWPAIVDRDTWHAVQAVLNDPKRKATPAHYSRSLLSGVAVCHTCGSRIQAGGRRQFRKGEPPMARYRCSTNHSHVTRLADPIDEYVTDLVVARLSQPDAAALLDTGPEVDAVALRRQMSDIQQRIDGAAEAFADGDITRAEWKRASDRLKDRLAEVESQMPRTGPESLSRLVTATDVAGVWGELSTDVRRGVIDALMTIRVVAPGTKENAYRWENGVRRINPDTVIIEWR